MVIVDGVKSWLWQVALKKAIFSAVKVVVSFLASIKVVAILTAMGINIDITIMEGFLTTLLTSLLTMLQNWLKVKKGINWL